MIRIGDAGGNANLCCIEFRQMSTPDTLPDLQSPKVGKMEKVSLLSSGASRRINADMRMCDRGNISSPVWLKQRSKKLNLI
ncbi:MAG: hypothetical protein ACYTX0_45710 [Nostoc sp.]